MNKSRPNERTRKLTENAFVETENLNILSWSLAGFGFLNAHSNFCSYALKTLL